jgi:hypothetical protein
MIEIHAGAKAPRNEKTGVCILFERDRLLGPPRCPSGNQQSAQRTSLRVAQQIISLALRGFAQNACVFEAILKAEFDDAFSCTVELRAFPPHAEWIRKFVGLVAS